MKNLAKNRAKTQFVDHSTAFIDNETAELKREFHIGDGVHLSTLGYEQLIANFRKALVSNPAVSRMACNDETSN